MPTHDSMVKSVADHLATNGYTNVMADVQGYACPGEICWKSTRTCHIPDVTARCDETRYIFEIETEETIAVEHTQSQFKLFHASCAQFGGVFCVVVPKASVATANRVLAQLGIAAQVWTVG